MNSDPNINPAAKELIHSKKALGEKARLGTATEAASRAQGRAMCLRIQPFDGEPHKHLAVQTA